MTVVDANTGRFVGKNNMEDTILKTNIEAAEEVVRQLRLRNIGGLIVIDFIDMNLSVNRQKLVRHLEKALQEKDKFQSVVLKVSEFGLVEMTRKRSGKTLEQQLTHTCATCHGSGYTASVQTDAYAVLRNIKDDLAHRTGDGTITLLMSRRIFDYISKIEYNAMLDLEKQGKCKITLMSSDYLVGCEYKIEKS
jgi:ribonuclease G